MNLASSTATSPPRTLLSNATACQVLANIIAMQFYYGDPGYAYDYYDNYIWDSSGLRGIWLGSYNR